MRKVHRIKKTFAKVPMGGLFTMKDDPGNALLQKVAKKKYRVLRSRSLPKWTGGTDFSKGLVFDIDPTAVIKQGRQS